MRQQNLRSPESLTPPSPNQWLAFVTQLPIDDPAGRMRVLRMLETLGCAMLRDGVYFLPDSTANRRGLVRLADYVGGFRGIAHILAVSSADEEQSSYFKGLFDRSSKYRELATTIDSLALGFGVSDPVAINRVLTKQRRSLEALKALDFFGSPLRAKAEQALREMEARVRELMFPEGASNAPAGSVARASRSYFRRHWATKTPLFADRLATAWLIRRFIDPEAAMVWLDNAQACPASAVSFGYDGATFRNSKLRVTYEEMLASFKLDTDPALAKIGGLVRAVEEGGTKVPEAAGVETLLAGAKRRAFTTDELLAESEKTFDLLYEVYFDSPARNELAA
jgi:hypothetical protein